MFGPLLFVFILVSCVALLTILYRRQPLKPLTLVKPSFVFFPKYSASYQRSDEEVEQSIMQLGFRPSGAKDQYARGTLRTGLTTKSVKLTISLDREKKEIQIYSSFFGILYDNGDIWQVTHHAVHGLEQQKSRTQELVDLFDNKQ